MSVQQCWEYKVLEINPEARVEVIEKELNQMGEVGWEICGVFPDDGIVIFKRASDGKGFTRD